MSKWTLRFLAIGLISLCIQGWENKPAEAIDGLTFTQLLQLAADVQKELDDLEDMKDLFREGARRGDSRHIRALERIKELQQVLRSKMNHIRNLFDFHYPRPGGGASHGSRLARGARGRGGFITLKGLGVLVAVELTIIATELSIEYRHEVFSFAEDPNFEYVNEVEESLVTLNIFSGGYWQGFGNYYSGYLPWNWGN